MGGNGPVACSHVKNDYMVDVIVEHITNARRSSGSSASWFARQMKRGQIIRFKNQRPSLKNYRAMCGISIAWGPVAEIEPSTTSLIPDELKKEIQHRGPDYHSAKRIWLDRMQDGSIFCLDIMISVLHMRGRCLSKQPFISKETGDIFGWNGEIFSSSIFEIGDENDGEKLANYLFCLDKRGFEKNLMKTFSDIDGPFAFFYFDAKSRALYISRDLLGKRSLVLGKGPNNIHVVSSVCTIEENYGPWEELSTEGVYRFIFHNYSTEMSLLPWDIPLGERFKVCRKIPSADEFLFPQELSPSGLPKLSVKTMENLQIFEKLLLKSTAARVLGVPQCGIKGRKPRVSIMFSGGIDCTVLAAMCHQCIPTDEPIDLLNVAFENPRKIKLHGNRNKYDVPDRLLGRISFEELSKTFPRDWRFVEIDVPFETYQRNRARIIDLMHPLDTVMDLSIAAAFWFASRGMGTINSKYYISEAKVVISGLGADELMGGYSHHRSALCKYESYEKLFDSLDKDISRLPHRNLGRDDRLISSHGKELRLPFLSFPVIQFLSALEVQNKCDLRPHIPKGIGEKLFIRNFAKHILRLNGVATERKRAVQFGASSAKLTDGREKGEELVQR